MISNGFDTAKVLDALRGRLGWRQPANTGPTYDVTQQRADKYYVVGSGQGNAPAPGATALVDPDLKGFTYSVERRGIGTLMASGLEITINASGGFSLVNPADLFFDGDVLIVHFQPKTTVLPAGTSSGPVLSPDNVASASGRYFQDFHAMVRIKTLYDTMEQVGASDDQFNTYLSNLQDAAILSALNAVFSKPQLIESYLLFEKGVFYPQPIQNSGKFVGFQFRLAPGPFAVQIKTLELFFSKDCTFNLYLYNENRIGPLWEKEVTAVAGDQSVIELQDGDLVLKHSTINNKGGLFYLGYFQDDLAGAEALEQPVDIWGCGNVFGAVSFESEVAAGNFDRVNVYENYRNYGLNCEVSGYYDFTREIIQNSFLFDELVGLQMAARVIEKTVFPIRTNAGERMAEDNGQKVYTDLNLAQPTEDSPFSVGLRGQITREIKRVTRTFFEKPRIQTTTPSC